MNQDSLLKRKNSLAYLYLNIIYHVHISKHHLVYINLTIPGMGKAARGDKGE
jgi:hypothetical protein